MEIYLWLAKVSFKSTLYRKESIESVKMKLMLGAFNFNIIHLLKKHRKMKEKRHMVEMRNGDGCIHE